MEFEAVEGAAEVAFSAAALAFEVLALLVLVVAAVRAGGRMLTAFMKHHSAFRDIRLQFGRALILALELLVAADVLQTAVAPSFDALLVVGLVVVIRTVLSLTIEWEVRRVREDEEREARRAASPTA